MTPEERVRVVQLLIDKLSGRDPITSVQDWIMVLEALKGEMIEQHRGIRYVVIPEREGLYAEVTSEPPPPRIGSRRIES